MISKMEYKIQAFFITYLHHHVIHEYTNIQYIFNFHLFTLLNSSDLNLNLLIYKINVMYFYVLLHH